MPVLDLLDHDRCPPWRHRTAANPARGETPDPNGEITCTTCGGTLFHCAEAAAVNKRHGGYERTYLHTSKHLEETCR